MFKKAFFTFLALSLAACSSAGALSGAGTAKVQSSAQVQVVQSKAEAITTPQAPDADVTAVANGNNAFAVDLFHQLAASDNLFFSPYSISAALAMTYAGAQGDTATQMASALHFSLSQERLHAALNALALDLQSRSKVQGLKPDQTFQLNVANSLWGQQGFSFKADFLDLLARDYGAGMRLVDFEKDPESARQAVNAWVSDATNQRITNILPPGSVDTLTRLVLANAIYFKAPWMQPFESSATQDADFHHLDGSTVSAPMMQRTGEMSYAEGANFQLLELPYAGGQVSMIVLLPKSGQFADVAKNLTVGQLDQAIGSLRSTQVDLSLPKFKFDWSAALPDALKALGMTDAFDDQADFSGMDGAKDLYISNVLHKSFVAVDENGTEAAAATAVAVAGMAAPVQQNPVEFKADRPFLFLIRDNPTGTILFMGQVIDPVQ
jgi:serpin B